MLPFGYALGWMLSMNIVSFLTVPYFVINTKLIIIYAAGLSWLKLATLALYIYAYMNHLKGLIPTMADGCLGVMNERLNPLSNDIKHSYFRLHSRFSPTTTINFKHR